MKNMKEKLQSAQEDKFTIWFFYIVAVAAVIGAFYTFFVAGIPGRGTFYSVLILKPGSYSHYADSNATGFSFTVRNVEGADAVYNVKYLANNVEIGSEQLTVADAQEIEISKSFDLGSAFVYPIKIEVFAEANGKTYSVFYWLKESR